MFKLNPLQMISHMYSDDLDEIDNLIDFQNEQNSTDQNLVNQNSTGQNLMNQNSTDLNLVNQNSTDQDLANQNEFIIDKILDIKCSVCLLSNFKYKCPSCLVQTCSLDCFKRHKVTFDCTGLKSSLKFKRLAIFDDNQLKDDFQFLEDYNRQMDGVKRQKRNLVQSLNELPNWLKKLKYEAFRRMIKLKILPAGFKRRLQNKTTFMYSTKEILWDIELVFVDLNLKPNEVKSNEDKSNLDKMDSNKLNLNKLNYKSNTDSEVKRLTFHIQRVSENQKLNDLLNAYLRPASLIENQQLNRLLKFYQNATENEISILIKLSFDNYIELDQKQTINECLKNKTIIEYPTILVVLKKNLTNYNIINEKELKNRMQVHADKSYNLMIKNGLIRNNKPRNDRVMKNRESELIDNLKVDNDKDELLITLDEKLEDQNLVKQNDEYFEESDSEDDAPEEVETKFVFDNTYID